MAPSGQRVSTPLLRSEVTEHVVAKEGVAAATRARAVSFARRRRFRAFPPDGAHGASFRAYPLKHASHSDRAARDPFGLCRIYRVRATLGAAAVTVEAAPAPIVQAPPPYAQPPAWQATPPGGTVPPTTAAPTFWPFPTNWQPPPLPIPVGWVTIPLGLPSLPSLPGWPTSGQPGSPSPNAQSAPRAAPGNGSDVGQQCVDTINRYRNTKGLPPLTRWLDGEGCATQEAAEDSGTQRPHGSFGRCQEHAQNACPNWPGPPRR